jgi:hypothetical protein
VGDTVDEETGEIAEDTRPEPPKLAPLDLSHATPELFAALAEAQAAVGTVTKDARNKHAGYDYASADSMIRGGREARAGTGLALFTTWSFTEIDGAESDDGQWPCAIVTMHFVLTHASGGRLSGKLSMHAIGSKRRPPDKAIAAAATYAEGFVERNLMRLDRAEEAEHDVERREEQDTRPARKPQQRPTQQKPQERRALSAKLSDCDDEAQLEAWVKRYGVAVMREGESAIKNVAAQALKLGLEEDDPGGNVSSYAWVMNRLQAMVSKETAA